MINLEGGGEDDRSWQDCSGPWGQARAEGSVGPKDPSQLSLFSSYPYGVKYVEVRRSLDEVWREVLNALAEEAVGS